MSQTDTDECVICKYVEGWKCKSANSAFTNVKKIGITTICNISADQRKDNLHTYIKDQSLIRVHEVCRIDYIKVKIDLVQTKKRKRSTSSNVSSSDENEIAEFDFKKHCIICAKNIHHTQAFSVVSSNETKQLIINYQTKNECLSQLLRDIIINKLLCEDDLTVLNAKYHRQNCHSKLKQGKTEKEESLRDKLMRSMEEIFNYIDEDEETQFKLEDFQKLLSDKNLYIPSSVTIWSRLKNHYQDDIIIIKKQGTQGYCCLQRTGYDIFNKSYKESKHESLDYQLLDKAAKILFNDIKDYTTEDLNEYPASDSMLDKAKKIPQMLKYFLEKLILNQYRKEKKREHYESQIISIAHAIMSSMFPRLLLSPLHIAVGVALHRKFGSRELVDMCHAMGFSCSYNEVRTYEISAAMQGEIELKEGAFIQFVSDNADWNIETLDGKGTFHSLGGCEIITPASDVLPRKPFARLKNVLESDIAEKSKIPIQSYQFSPLEGIKFYQFPNPSPELNLKFSKASKICTFWMFLKFIKPGFEKGWNGYIENLTDSNTKYELSSINFLPFIHAYPSEYSTLLTAITQSISHARKFGMKTCIITFDQPLYFKARDIIGVMQMDPEIEVVIRLGGFHTLLSFLGSIGFIMKDSGLVEVLLSVYGENTVKQILSGHQYARALRAHSLVLLALAKKIFTKIEKKTQFQENVDHIKNHGFMLPSDLDELESDEIFENVTSEFQKELEQLEKQNYTCKLWVQYCRMVLIVKDFIFAEKCGNWELHLNTVERMIPFFHATGHFPYAKSAQIYLNDMRALGSKIDSLEFEKFTKSGFWTARRSDRFYSGIFTDQTIEQTLMRLLKFEGGLFRRGVTESTAYQWIGGFIFTKDIIEGIEKFTNCSLDKNYQHKDSSDSRVQKDLSSLKLIEEFFAQYDPFPDNIQNLINIANGMSATDDSNCHNAFEVGIEIMTDISGTTFKDLKLSRSRLVKTIASANSTITIDKKKVEIDPDILFHRICVIKKNDEEMQDYLEYELAPFPQAYFDTFGMLKNTKSDLYSLFNKVTINVRDPMRTHFVIDGGFLLHKVKWTLNQTFLAIVNNYVRYIVHNYGDKCTVVFDGYESPTTKACERSRRASQKISADVFFNENMPLKINQESFLRNAKNKTNIIKMLRNKMTEVGIQSVQCPADADRTIVATAVKLAEDIQKIVVVVTEDTDVLVLVTALTPIIREIFVLKPARQNKTEELYSSKSLSHLQLVADNILFLHAFTGCDTVSATYYQGKTKFIKSFQSYPDLALHASKFKEIGLSTDDIIEHGCQLVLAMYNAPLTFRKPMIPDQYKQSSQQLLESYRYRLYLMSIAKCKKVVIGKILPTVDAITQHLKRVYLQVQNWLHGDDFLNAEDWGWEMRENQLVPIRMTQPPGPPNIMKLIFCSCTTGCGNSCGCRKQGLFCNVACKNCAGGNCTNIENYDITEEQTEEWIEENKTNSDEEEK